MDTPHRRPATEREDSAQWRVRRAFRFSVLSMLVLTLLVAVVCYQQLRIRRLRTNLFYLREIRRIEAENRQLEVQVVRIQNELAQMHTGTPTRLLAALVHHGVSDACDETVTEPSINQQVPEPSDAPESASRGVLTLEDQPRGPGDR